MFNGLVAKPQMIWMWCSNGFFVSPLDCPIFTVQLFIVCWCSICRDSKTTTTTVRPEEKWRIGIYPKPELYTYSELNVSQVLKVINRTDGSKEYVTNKNTRFDNVDCVALLPHSATFTSTFALVIFSRIEFNRFLLLL